MDRDADFSDYARTRWRALVRAGVLLGCNVGEAEDLAQQTLLRCYLKWERVDRATGRDAYVARIQFNLLRQSLRHYLHLSERQIAAATGVAPGTVKSRPLPGAGHPRRRREPDRVAGGTAMTEQRLHELMERSVAGVRDSPPPVSELLRRGRARRRRRRPAAIGAAAGAVVLVLATGAAVRELLPRSTPADPAHPTSALRPPPSGTKWVGVGRRVVAVPTDWPVVPGIYCQGPAPFFVTITAWRVASGCIPAATPDVTRASLDLEARPSGGLTARLSGSSSLTQHGVDASRTTLPSGWLAVPSPGPAGGAGPSTLGGEVAALESAGFRVVRRTAGADPLGRAVTTDPETGTPAIVGSTVVVYDHGPVASSATLSGRLVWVGGPAGHPSAAHAGTVHLVSADDAVDQTVAAGPDGRWTAVVPPGTYRVRATSPGYLSARGADDACRADDVTVRAHASVAVDVVCSLR